MFILWVFNLGYLFQHLGTLLQMRRIENKRSTEGVCVDTQILFFVGAIARCIWISDTILKNFFLTYFELILALVTLGFTLYLILIKHRGYESLENALNRKEIPIYYRWYVVLAVSCVAAYFFFPGNVGQSFDVQMLVALTIYCEAGGLLPQIYLVNKEKDSNNFSKFYIVFLSFSRVFRLLFWLRMYLDKASFFSLMAADIVHTVMVSGFVYTFFKNLDRMSLPTAGIKHGNVSKKIF